MLVFGCSDSRAAMIAPAEADVSLLNPEIFPNTRIDWQRPVRSVMRAADPLTSTDRSGLRIRTARFPKSLYPRLVVALRMHLMGGVLPTFGNSPAKNLWCCNGLESAEILAEFQRPFSKREYGGSNPAKAANQCGLYVCLAYVARIRAVAGLLASCGRSLDSRISKSVDNYAESLQRHSAIF